MSTRVGPAAVDDGSIRDHFEPLTDPFALPRAAVTASVEHVAQSSRRTPIDQAGRSLTGTLVHRLFERFGTVLSDEAGVPRIAGELARLLRDEEAIEAGDVERVFARAGEAYLALCGQPRLVDALASGEPIFEVPFSVRPAAAPMILRGTFDCLVRRRDGGITVLELKTGTPAPGHEQQLATYVAAARALFPDAPVEGTLVYARDGAP